jgi:hypothetical protein
MASREMKTNSTTYKVTVRVCFYKCIFPLKPFPYNNYKSCCLKSSSITNTARTCRVKIMEKKKMWGESHIPHCFFHSEDLLICFVGHWNWIERWPKVWVSLTGLEKLNSSSGIPRLPKFKEVKPPRKWEYRKW